MATELPDAEDNTPHPPIRSFFFPEKEERRVPCKVTGNQSRQAGLKAVFVRIYPRRFHTDHHMTHTSLLKGRSHTGRKKKTERRTMTKEALLKI